MTSEQRAGLEGVYRFAGKQVRVKSLLSEVHVLCRDYRASGIQDFAVQTSRADIDFEREKSMGENRWEERSIQRFSDGYLETLAVYRKIAERMPYYDTLLFHGSAIAVDGEGYLFTAGSGTGKSTHARLWRELLGDRTIMVNDDKPLIGLNESETIVYGTPWDGKHRLSSNTAVPLRGVCVLERSSRNHIRRISPSEALPMLLQQVYRPMDADAMMKTLDLVDCLAGRLKLYRLGCNMEAEAARVAYDAMKGDSPAADQMRCL